jgi:hypothetical protein
MSAKIKPAGYPKPRRVKKMDNAGGLTMGASSVFYYSTAGLLGQTGDREPLT